MRAYIEYEFVAIVRVHSRPRRSRLAGTSSGPHRCPCLHRPATGSISPATGFQMVRMTLGVLQCDETERGCIRFAPAFPKGGRGCPQM